MLVLNLGVLSRWMLAECQKLFLCSKHLETTGVDYWSWHLCSRLLHSTRSAVHFGADLGHELIRDKLVKGLGSEVMESVMLHSSFEGALALQKVGSCGSPLFSWTLASYGFGPGVAILILRTEHLKHNVLFMTPDICSRSLIQQGRKFG